MKMGSTPSWHFLAIPLTAFSRHTTPPTGIPVAVASTSLWKLKTCTAGKFHLIRWSQSGSQRRFSHGEVWKSLAPQAHQGFPSVEPMASKPLDFMGVVRDQHDATGDHGPSWDIMKVTDGQYTCHLQHLHHLPAVAGWSCHKIRREPSRSPRQRRPQWRWGSPGTRFRKPLQYMGFAHESMDLAAQIVLQNKCIPAIIEGSLETKLPTMWTHGKAQPGRSSDREKVRREEIREGEDQRWRKSEERCSCTKR